MSSLISDISDIIIELLQQEMVNRMLNKEFADEIIEGTPLREQVADILRRMIIGGDLGNGEKISERSISQLLKVSTTPVKEAFRTLESEGLIYSVPRKGSYISELSMDHVWQIVFMRGALESVAAYIAAIQATEEEIEGMAQALDESKRLTEAGVKSTEVSKYNALFHERVRSAARNPYLTGLIIKMSSIDNAVRQVALAKDVEEQLRGQQEHRAILDAIKMHDSARAEQLMVSHIRRTVGFVLKK